MKFFSALFFTRFCQYIESQLETYVSCKMKEEANIHVLEKYSKLMIDIEQNVDYLNVRYLLCKAMQGFSNSCEAKTKILIPLFFRFIKLVLFLNTIHIKMSIYYLTLSFKLFN